MLQRLVDLTFLTEDEDSNLTESILAQIEEALVAANLDSYNEQYLVEFSVRKVKN